MRDLLSAGLGVRLEVRLRTKDGQVRTNLVAADIIDLKGERCLLTASLDIEDRRQNESALQFLDDLGQRVMPLSDANEILRSMTAAVGSACRLRLRLCGHGAGSGPLHHSRQLARAWRALDCRTLLSCGFRRARCPQPRRGQPLVLSDNARELPAHEAKTFLEIGLAATICMPLVKSGRLTALMAIHDRVPRRWSEREQSLFREVTERCWRAYRARAADRTAEGERNAIPRRRHHGSHCGLGDRHGHALANVDGGGPSLVRSLPCARSRNGRRRDDEFWNALHPADKTRWPSFTRRPTNWMITPPSIGLSGPMAGCCGSLAAAGSWREARMERRSALQTS